MSVLNRFNGVIVLPADVDQPDPGSRRLEPQAVEFESLSEWDDCPHCECYWDGVMCCDCGEGQG